MYQPSGIVTSFGLRRHSFWTRVYTLPWKDGPARTGLDSVTSTVLEHPLAQA